MKVSIIIKALNEEGNITRAIESSLAAIAKVGEGEVILADSLSIDQTVKLASRYPIHIVQLVDPADRCCGVGAELGYRIARGEYLYILDADMELNGDFLVAAVAALDNDIRLGGVGGRVEEMHIMNAEFRRRVEDDIFRFGEVDSLNMGGLYRKSAITPLGYMTNRNLHAYEEYELALRLRSAGWRLLRLDIPAIKHYGHTDTSFRLLWRRWHTRHAWAAGELLREVWGKPYLKETLSGIAQYRLFVIVSGWWLGLLFSFAGAIYQPIFWWVLILLVITPFVLGILRKRSVMDGVYMVVSQNLHAVGLVMGCLFHRRSDPAQSPKIREVKQVG